MKNKVTLVLLFFSVLFLFLANISAAQNITSCDAGDKTCRINNGYVCLQKNIDAKKCSSLAPDEKVFSFITSGSCESEVESDSKYMSNNQGSIRYTALAVLGGATSNDPEEWLDSKNRTTENLNWYLQIESPDVAECKVTRGSSVSTVSLNADKTISASGGLDSCLSISSGDYWLQISQNCFNTEFKISCDKSFLTSLLYQKSGSSTIYVSDETHSASASGETKEKVRSLCFGTSSCDYEGSLWATLVLSSLNHDVSSFIPYLVTNADTGNNKNYLPNAFLYLLTGDFQTELLSQQKADKWWEASTSSNRFYDTALALYSLKYDEPIQKQNAEKWLLDEAQGSDGCWNSGNIRDTAFILYSLEPRSSGGFAGSGDDGEITESDNDCESSGYYCMSGISCSQAGGNIKSSYSCSGTFVCCDQQREIQTCSEQNGNVCSSGKTCSGTEVEASDISSGEICCVQGSCITPSESPAAQCENSGGTCRIGSCLSGEQESSESCQFSTDVCCIQKSDDAGINLKNVSSLWIWILLVLILLLVLGIIFRDKLRMLWFRISSGGGQSSHPHSGPSTRPPFMPSVPRMIPRSSPVMRRTTPSRRPGEIDEVLKKLKEMGR